MTDEPQPPLNREQRRRQKFHRHATARQDNLQTQRQNNTGFLTGLPGESTEGLDTVADEAPGAAAAGVESTEPPISEAATEPTQGAAGADVSTEPARADDATPDAEPDGETPKAPRSAAKKAAAT